MVPNYTLEGYSICRERGGGGTKRCGKPIGGVAIQRGYIKCYKVTQDNIVWHSPGRYDAQTGWTQQGEGFTTSLQTHHRRTQNSTMEWTHMKLVRSTVH